MEAIYKISSKQTGVEIFRDEAAVAHESVAKAISMCKIKFVLGQSIIVVQ